MCRSRDTSKTSARDVLVEDALKSPPSGATEEAIFAYMEASEETTLLDFGCGYGRYLVMFSKHIKTGNLFGAEIDKQRVAVAREMGFNCYEPDPNIPEIPFENNYFDYVFSSDVVEHIPQNHYKKYLLEFHRVLKPGGRLLIGTPNYPFKRIYDFVKAIKTRMFRYYLLDDPGHVNKLSIRRLTRDLEEVFPIVNIRPTYVLFENRFGFIRRNRDRLRLICDKVFGYCEKA